MTTSARTIRRALVMTALSIMAVFGLSGQAYAHPDITNVTCDPMANSTFGCWVFYANAHQPVRIRWYVNGNLDSTLNDLWHFTRGCARGQQVFVKVVVSDVHGSDTASTSVLCGGTAQ